MALIVHLENKSGGGGGVSHHELLGGLQGGGVGEHYHLTRQEWERLRKILEHYDKLIELLEKPTPQPEPEPDEYDGGFASTPENAYTKVLDGGFAPDEDGKIIDGGGA